MANFECALNSLKAGGKVQRMKWNDPRVWVMLHRPDEEHSKLTVPFFFMATARGNYIPWSITQSDVLAEDWMIL